MKLRTLNIPALSNANPGRPGWSIAQEVAQLANQGTNSLAAAILRSGYNPAEPVSVAVNGGESMADLAAGILAGLDSRKAKDGTVKSLALAVDGQTGASIPVSVDDIRLALSECEPENWTPDYAIPAGGDGRRRTVAYVLGALYAAVLKRTPGPMATVNCATEKGIDSLRTNLGRSFGKALGPWQKVQAAVEVIKSRPLITEAELQSEAGCLRGDAQLMHRAGQSIVKHGLAIDTEGRCPGKEEWLPILKCATKEEAQTMLATVVADVAPKRIGIDKVAEALALLPEGATIGAREFAAILEKGTHEALSAFIQPLLK